MADLRHLLAIYVHAHQTGNSVPPHIDAEARWHLGLPVSDGPKEFARWGRPAPAPPADGEVAELVVELRRFRSVSCHRAAELLERQALVPVAVSERPLEPEDCDAEGRCWWFCPTSVLPNGMLPYWCLGPADPPKSWFTHRLPAHALPIPKQQEINNG